MIECGICTHEVEGAARIIRRVSIADSAGTAVGVYDLCKIAAKTSRELAEDLYRTFQSMHHRQPGQVRLRAFKGYVFTIRHDVEPVRQPAAFDGTPAQAEAAGWELTDRGWICPDCKTEAHRPEASEAGTGGLEGFFEETKDL